MGYGIWNIDMGIHHIDMIIRDIDMGHRIRISEMTDTHSGYRLGISCHSAFDCAAATARSSPRSRARSNPCTSAAQTFISASCDAM
jgi:hypothetical protein